MRKLAAMFAALALTVGLLGAGLSATFTDSATAQMTVQVGTFNIDVSTTTPGASVDCPAGVPGGTCTITFSVPEIQSSAAGSAPFSFQVTSTGSIPALVSVTASTPDAPFVDMLVGSAPLLLSEGEFGAYNGGLSWTELGNAQLGMTTSITYTISASA